MIMDTARIKRFPVLLFLALFFLIAGASNAMATSANITASGNEGAIPVSASAVFSTHTFCSGSGDNKTCWTDNSGTESVLHSHKIMRYSETLLGMKQIEKRG